MFDVFSQIIFFSVGYQKEKIKIDRDEDGAQIAVSGEKAATGLLARKLSFRQTSQVTKFRKVFWIPDGVVADQINARFKEKEALLWLFMPKLVKGVSGVGIEEVKEEEISREGHSRSRPTLPHSAKNEVEMKELKKDLPDPEPEVKEASHGKGEEEMKDVKPTVAVVGGLPHHQPEVKEATERERTTRYELEMEEGKKDIHADEVGGRLPQRKPEEVGEAIFKKDEAAERENPNKDEEEMGEEKKDLDMEATGEVFGRLTQHESQEVNGAADVTITSPEEQSTPTNKGTTPSKEDTPGKEESDLEAKGRAAEDKSEECQHGQDATESTIVEADQVTQRAHAEEFDAHEGSSDQVTHPSQKEPDTEIQEMSQLIYDQVPLSDPTQPLEPVNPEEVQGMDQAETDPVTPCEEKFSLFSSSLFAGSAILVSIAVFVVYFCRSYRR